MPPTPRNVSEIQPHARLHSMPTTVAAVFLLKLPSLLGI